MNKAQLSFTKKIAKLVFFSLSFAFVIALSAPFSITSHAYAIGIESSQSALDVLLGLGGFSGVEDLGSDTISLDDWVAAGGDKEAYLGLYGGFFDSANQYYSGLGDYLLSKLKLAYTTGTLSLQRSFYEKYLEFCSYLASQSASSSVKVGEFAADVASYAGNSSYSLYYSGYNTYGGNFYYDCTFNINELVDEFIVIYREFNNTYYFVPKTFVSLNDTFLTFNVNDSQGVSSPPVASQTGNATTGKIATFFVTENSYSTINSFLFPFDLYVLSGTSTDTDLYNLVNVYRTFGTLNITFDIIAQYIGGVENVVTDGNSVADDGTISGNISVVINSSDIMSQLIDLLQSGSISLSDYLSSVGVGVVSDGMTVADLRELVSTLPAVTDQTLTIGETGSAAVTQSASKVGTLAHVEHAIANAIAAATGQALPYPDEDPDYVPPGDPHIEDWDFPSLDPDNPDPGGSEEESEEDRNRAADVADGIGVVAGLAGDIFDSASGFNLVTTVGYSFVIFSAILGASHFFGALGGRHDDVKAHPLDWNRSERWTSKNTDFKSDW